MTDFFPAVATRDRYRRVALVLLVGLADVLFWDQRPGLSVALFAAVLFVAGVWRVRPLSRLVRPALVLIVAALPAVEYLQPLSLLFLLGGLILALVLAQGGGALAALAFLRALPGRWAAPLNPVALWHAARALPAGAGTWRHLVALWAFPLGGTAVFLALMLEANPLLARLATPDLDLLTVFRRGLFWAGVALLTAPFLAGLPTPAAAPSWRWRGAGLSGASVIRALILFNLVIGVQGISDASILIGGAALPDGMTYADYAHRGAYPLLATAMLAGGFALAARPFLGAHRAIGPLLLLWLAQNVVLCGAAALRLDLYVQAYGLTYLRLRAFVWMGLVAGGLMLCLWQVLARRETAWLLVRVAAMAGVVLYGASFVNFAAIVAADNLRRPQPDLAYVCSLGRMAAGAWQAASPAGAQPGWSAGFCSAQHAPVIQGWRDWGFRAWRVGHSLEGLEGGR